MQSTLGSESDADDEEEGRKEDYLVCYRVSAPLASPLGLLQAKLSARQLSLTDLVPNLRLEYDYQKCMVYPDDVRISYCVNTEFLQCTMSILNVSH